MVDIKKTLERLYMTFVLIGTKQECEMVIEIFLKDGSVMCFVFNGERKRDLRLIKKSANDS